MKLIKYIALTVILFIILSVLAFYIIYKTTDIVNNSLSSFLNELLKDDVSISFKNMRGFFYNEVELEDLKIVLKSGEVISANYFSAKYDILDIIDGNYIIPNILIDSIVIDLSKAEKKQSEKSDFFDIYNVLDNNYINASRILIRSGKMIFDDQNQAEINYRGNFKVLEDEIDIGIENFGFTWNRDVKNKIIMSCNIVGDRSGVTLNQLKLLFNNSEIIGKGQYQFAENNDYHLFIDDAKLRSKDLEFLANILKTKSDFYFNAELKGNSEGMRINLALDSAHYDFLSFKKSKMDAFYNFDKNILNIFNSEFAVNRAKFKINGSVLGKNNQFQIYFSELNLKEFGVGNSITLLNGRAEFNQSKIDFSDMSTDNNSLFLEESEFDKYKINQAKIDFTNENGIYSINSGSYIKIGNKSIFNFDGVIDQKNKQIKIQSTSENSQFIDLLNLIGINNINGRFRSTFNLWGNFDHLQAYAYLFTDSINIYNDFISYKNTIEFAISSINNFKAIMISKSDSNILMDRKFNSFNTQIKFSGDSIGLERVELRQKNDGIYLKGALIGEDLKSKFVFDSVSVSLNEVKIHNINPLIITKLDSSYFFKKTEFISPDGGNIILEGNYEANKNELKIAVNNINIRPFNNFINFKYNIDAILDGSVIISDLRKLETKGELSFNKITLLAKEDSLYFQITNKNKLELGNASLKFSFNLDEIRLQKFALINGNETISAYGNIKLADSLKTYVFDTEIKNIDVQKLNLFALYQKELKGNINSQIQIAGDINSINGKATMQLNSISANKINYSGNLQLLLTGSSISIKETKIKANQSWIEIEAWKEIDFNQKELTDKILKGPIKVNIYSIGDTITALTAINPEIQAIYGDYEIKASITGTLDHPTIENGLLRLTNAQLSLERLANRILNVNYNGVIANNRLAINQLKLYTVSEKSGIFSFLQSEKKGDCTINGLVDLSHLFHPVIRLNISMNHFYVDYYKENAKVNIYSNNLKVSGRDTLQIYGDMTIRDSEIFFDYENQVKSENTDSKELSDKYNEISVFVHLEDNVRIYNDDENGIRGFDIILSTPSNQGFQFKKVADGGKSFRGIVNINDGTFVTYQVFNITKGTLDFNRKSGSNLGFNPFVNFEGSYFSDQYLFQIKFNDFFDKLSELKIEIYDINNQNTKLAKTEAQIISLLVLGQENFADPNADYTRGVFNYTKTLASGVLRKSFVEDFKLISGSDDKKISFKDLNEVQGVKFTTKSLNITNNLRIKAEINASEKSNIIDKLEMNYRVTNNINLYISNENSNVSFGASEVIQNLRLQWYYEF